MDPVTYAVQMAPPGYIRDNIAYYSTCVGTNPSQQYVDDAFSAVATLNTTITTLYSSVCPGNTDLLSMFSTTAAMDASIDAINTDLACPPLQSHWLSLMESDICKDAFEGLYVFWIAQYLTFAFLFALLIISSVIHNFYGIFWNVTEQSLNVHYSKRQKVVEATELAIADEQALEEAEQSSNESEESSHHDDEHSDQQRGRRV